MGKSRHTEAQIIVTSKTVKCRTMSAGGRARIAGLMGGRHIYFPIVWTYGAVVSGLEFFPNNRKVGMASPD